MWIGNWSVFDHDFDEGGMPPPLCSLFKSFFSVAGSKRVRSRRILLFLISWQVSGDSAIGIWILLNFGR